MTSGREASKGAPAIGVVKRKCSVSSVVRVRLCRSPSVRTASCRESGSILATAMSAPAIRFTQELERDALAAIWFAAWGGI